MGGRQEFRAKLMMPLPQLALQTIPVVMDEAPPTLEPRWSPRAAVACRRALCSALL
jgi:hypothetical protein